MEKLLKFLNKQFNSQLTRQPSYQIKIDEMHEVLKKYGVDWASDDEFGYFKNEVMYHSLINKKLFEDTFQDVHAVMFDYWYDLDYQERKHQVNVDIDRAKQSMKKFRYHEDDIYLPIFDERMNRIYSQEMVLFDLKQYGRIRGDFKDILVTIDYYGDTLYQSDFCSCRYIASYDGGCALYSEVMNRLYFVEKGTCKDMLSLDIACMEQIDERLLQIIVSCYANQDVKTLFDLLIEYHLIGEKVAKKLTKKSKKFLK